MRLCILETDRPAQAFQGTYGTYASMFERWLAPQMPETVFDRIYVAGGEPLPDDPCLYEGYLITGSRASVFEDHAWITSLSDFLRSVRAVRQPMGGVCFGHQIMAKAFGGEVRRSNAGWVVGQHEHEVNDGAGDIFGPGALSPNGGLLYDGFPATSVQVHPEFRADYVRDLLMSTAGIRVPTELVGPALASLSAPLDSGQIARAFARVFHSQPAVTE